VLGSAWLAYCFGLLFWACAPLLVGSHVVIVMSDSMRPGISAGDAVVVSAIGGREPRVGQIVLVRDAEKESGTVLHRVAQVRPDGAVITRGDANPLVDRNPVRREAILGTARLVVPRGGLLPLLWRRHDYGPLAALIGLLLAAFAAASGRSERPAAVAPAPAVDEAIPTSGARPDAVGESGADPETIRRSEAHDQSPA